MHTTYVHIGSRWLPKLTTFVWCTCSVSASIIIETSTCRSYLIFESVIIRTQFISNNNVFQRFFSIPSKKFSAKITKLVIKQLIKLCVSTNIHVSPSQNAIFRLNYSLFWIILGSDVDMSAFNNFELVLLRLVQLSIDWPLRVARCQTPRRAVYHKCSRQDRFLIFAENFVEGIEKHLWKTFTPLHSLALRG